MQNILKSFRALLTSIVFLQYSSEKPLERTGSQTQFVWESSEVFFFWNLDLNKEARACFPNITSSEAEHEGTLTEPLLPSCGIGGTAVGARSLLQEEEAGATKQHHKTDTFQECKLGMFLGLILLFRGGSRALFCTLHPFPLCASNQPSVLSCLPWPLLYSKHQWSL